MTDWRKSKYADIILRRAKCCVSACLSIAKYDVSIRASGAGEASDWAPYCTLHAQLTVERAERNNAAKR